MIGLLVGTGILATLLVAGYVGAALALRDLDSGRPPKAGPSFRLYMAASNGYARRSVARASRKSEQREAA